MGSRPGTARVRAWRSGLLAGLGALAPCPVHAESVDATRLVVLTTTDRTSMGGSGVAFATGANGLFFHPAAPAHRDPGADGPFALSVAFGNLRLGVGRPSDLANTGSAEGWVGGMSNLGLAAGGRHWGLGAVGSFLTYTQDDVTVTSMEAHATAAGAAVGDHLVFGGGYRLLTLSAESSAGEVAYAGSGLEGGVLLSEVWGGFNAGAAVRSGVTATNTAVSDAETIRVPVQLTAGLGWRSFRSVSTARWPATTLAADLVVDGRVDDGVLLEQMLVNPGGAAVPRGRNATASPHVGAQVELLPNRLRLRAGSYLEPARTSLAPDRLHGTGGFELRLLQIRALKGVVDFDLKWEAGVDAAPRYVNLAWLGIGLWSPLPPPIVASEDRIKMDTALDADPGPGESPAVE